MSLCILNCLNCTYILGDAYDDMVKLMIQGYTEDQAADAVGYPDSGITQCCRPTLIMHCTNNKDHIQFVKNQFELLKYNKNLSNKQPLNNGKLSASTNMYHDPSLCDNDDDFTDLNKLKQINNNNNHPNININLNSSNNIVSNNTMDTTNSK